MATYELVSKINNRYIFKYFPNGKEDTWGLVAVTYYNDDRDVEYLKLAEDDPHKFFASQIAWHANPNVVGRGTIAWY